MDIDELELQLLNGRLLSYAFNDLARNRHISFSNDRSVPVLENCLVEVKRQYRAVIAAECAQSKDELRSKELEDVVNDDTISNDLAPVDDPGQSLDARSGNEPELRQVDLISDDGVSRSPANTVLFFI